MEVFMGKRKNVVVALIALVLVIMVTNGLGAQAIREDPVDIGWHHGPRDGTGTGIPDPTARLEELSTEYEVELAVLQALVTEGYRVGELHIALEMAQESGSTLDAVLTLAGEGDRHDWRQVALTLGIDPESEAFLMLRSGEGRGPGPGRSDDGPRGPGGPDGSGGRGGPGGPGDGSGGPGGPRGPADGTGGRGGSGGPGDGAGTGRRGGH